MVAIDLPLSAADLTSCPHPSPTRSFKRICSSAAAATSTRDRSALDAEVVMLMRFKESPEPHPTGMLPPGFEEKVMHASFRIGGSMLVG